MLPGWVTRRGTTAWCDDASQPYLSRTVSPIHGSRISNQIETAPAEDQISSRPGPNSTQDQLTRTKLANASDNLASYINVTNSRPSRNGTLNSCIQFKKSSPRRRSQRQNGNQRPFPLAQSRCRQCHIRSSIFRYNVRLSGSRVEQVAITQADREAA